MQGFRIFWNTDMRGTIVGTELGKYEGGHVKWSFMSEIRTYSKVSFQHTEIRADYLPNYSFESASINIGTEKKIWYSWNLIQDFNGPHNCLVLEAQHVLI